MKSFCLLLGICLMLLGSASAHWSKLNVWYDAVKESGDIMSAEECESEFDMQTTSYMVGKNIGWKSAMVKDMALNTALKYCHGVLDNYGMDTWTVKDFVVDTAKHLKMIPPTITPSDIDFFVINVTYTLECSPLGSVHWEKDGTTVSETSTLVLTPTEADVDQNLVCVHNNGLVETALTTPVLSNTIRSAWTATTSGSHNSATQTTGPEQAIDSMTGDHNICFTTPNRNFNWLQIDFGSEITCIKEVIVLKRAQGEIPASNSIPGRFKNVEVRIGATETVVGHGLNQITDNTVCDTFTGPSDDLQATFTCSSALDGQYLTVQNTAPAYLGIDEIYVYAECSL